jgi:hypothetical protein
MDKVFNTRKHQYKTTKPGNNNNSRKIQPNNKTNTHTNMGETIGLNNEHVMRGIEGN